MLKGAPVFDEARSMHRRLTSDDLRAPASPVASPASAA